MIEVVRINNKKMVINAELIEFVETTPDTIITTITGKKIIVVDSKEDIIRKVVDYRRLCFPERMYKPLSDEELKLYNKED